MRFDFLQHFKKENPFTIQRRSIDESIFSTRLAKEFFGSVITTLMTVKQKNEENVSAKFLLGSECSDFLKR